MGEKFPRQGTAVSVKRLCRESPKQITEVLEMFKLHPLSLHPTPLGVHTAQGHSRCSEYDFSLSSALTVVTVRPWFEAQLQLLSKGKVGKG